jgi:hypothetical protein
MSHTTVLAIVYRLTARLWQADRFSFTHFGACASLNSARMDEGVQ